MKDFGTILSGVRSVSERPSIARTMHAQKSSGRIAFLQEDHHLRANKLVADRLRPVPALARW